MNLKGMDEILEFNTRTTDVPLGKSQQSSLKILIEFCCYFPMSFYVVLALYFRISLSFSNIQILIQFERSIKKKHFAKLFYMNNRCIQNSNLNHDQLHFIKEKKAFTLNFKLFILSFSTKRENRRENLYFFNNSCFKKKNVDKMITF